MLSMYPVYEKSHDRIDIYGGKPDGLVMSVKAKALATCLNNVNNLAESLDSTHTVETSIKTYRGTLTVSRKGAHGGVPQFKVTPSDEVRNERGFEHLSRGLSSWLVIDTLIEAMANATTIRRGK